MKKITSFVPSTYKATSGAVKFDTKSTTIAEVRFNEQQWGSYINITTGDSRNISCRADLLANDEERKALWDVLHAYKESGDQCVLGVVGRSIEGTNKWFSAIQEARKFTVSKAQIVDAEMLGDTPTWATETPSWAPEAQKPKTLSKNGKVMGRPPGSKNK